MKQKTKLIERTSKVTKSEKTRINETVNKGSQRLTQSSSRSQKKESSKINSLKRHIEKTIYPPRPTRKQSLKNKKKQNKI